MGIKTDLPYDDYGDYDNSNFPAGQTPRILIVTLTGIECGTLWTDAYELPKNGSFYLEQVNQYLWSRSYDWGNLHYHMGDSFSFCTCADNAGRYIYYSDLAGSTAFSNQSYYFDPTSRVWTGGYALATWQPPVGSLGPAGMLATLGMGPEEGLFLEALAVSATSGIFRFGKFAGAVSFMMSFSTSSE